MQQVALFAIRVAQFRQLNASGASSDGISASDQLFKAVALGLIFRLPPFPGALRANERDFAAERQLQVVAAPEKRRRLAGSG